MQNRLNPLQTLTADQDTLLNAGLKLSLICINRNVGLEMFVSHILVDYNPTFMVWMGPQNKATKPTILS